MPMHGWGGKKNGELLDLAAQEFDVFLTADRGIPYEQALSRLDLMIVVLRAGSNSFEDLKPLMEKASGLLSDARPGEAVIVEA